VGFGGGAGPLKVFEKGRCFHACNKIERCGRCVVDRIATHCATIREIPGDLVSRWKAAGGVLAVGRLTQRDD
jgi:hypothetical protein